MKITGFCPIIVTKEQESAVKVFEALGFERRHTKTDIEGGANVGIAMKDANGNRILKPMLGKDYTCTKLKVYPFEHLNKFT